MDTILKQFSSCFTKPSFLNFCLLAQAWLLCTGRRSIARVIQSIGIINETKHHSIFYRFFSRAVWDPDEIGLIILKLALKFLESVIVLMVDDTLCHRSGPHVFGGGMHHDAVRSTYGRGGKEAHKAFSFGLNWVVLSLWIPFPGGNSNGVALPFLFRLYRQKKTCPASEYSKRTELAKEMMAVAIPHLPSDREVILTGDSEYACKTLVRDLPNSVDFVGPITMDARVYEEPEKQPARGRKRIKGKQLPKPEALISGKKPWKKVTVKIYGRDVSILTKTMVGMWYTVSGLRLVRVVVTRDPSGRLKDRAFFSTNPSMSVESILVFFAKRWEIEVAFRNVKQHLGIENPQNGWWRRRKGEKPEPKKAGPNPKGIIGQHAIKRTVPFVFSVYAISVLWFLENANFEEVVSDAAQNAPWYRHKSSPSYLDVLVAIRRQIWRRPFSPIPFKNRIREKICDVLPWWLLAS